MKVIVADLARAEIAAILDHSLTRFGSQARMRYRSLIATALRDIATNPERRTSRVFDESRRLYHLRYVTLAGERFPVRHPRHFIVYCLSPVGVVEILRVLHDASDLPARLGPPPP